MVLYKVSWRFVGFCDVLRCLVVFCDVLVGYCVVVASFSSVL